MDTKNSLLVPIIVVVISTTIIGWYFFFREPIIPSSPNNPEVTAPTDESTQEPFTTDEIVGVWQGGVSIGTPWGNTYQFFPSGKYNYQINQVRCDSAERGHSGYWELEESNIKLTRITKNILEGDSLECGPSGGLQDGVLSPQKYSPSQVELLDVSRCDDYVIEELDRNYQCISLDEESFYKYSNDPTYGNDSDLWEEPIF
jgi:hypothetical protein